MSVLGYPEDCYVGCGNLNRIHPTTGEGVKKASLGFYWELSRPVVALLLKEKGLVSGVLKVPSHLPRAPAQRKINGVFPVSLPQTP